jgi:uncharacterized protein YbjT (DUF2867 family)
MKMSDNIQQITIFGGTGMLGRPVVREMVAAGFRVTAMVRDVAQAEKKLPDSVRLVEGDLARKKDIRIAMEGADAVYLNLSSRPEVKKYDSFIPERDGLENVLAVVDELNNGPRNGRNVMDLKVKRVAAISSLVQRYQGMDGFRWWAFEIKQWAEKTLREVDVPVTVFYPSSFMETIDQGGIMQGHRLMLVGKSRQPMHFIAGEDYGRMVAASFRNINEAIRKCGTNEVDGSGEENSGVGTDFGTEPVPGAGTVSGPGSADPHADCYFDVYGPEALTFDEASLEFVKNYRHGPLKITKVPMWPIRLVGAVNGEIHYLSRVMEALNNYREPGPDETVWKELGRPLVTLADYARKL